MKSATFAPPRLPSGFSPAIRDWIVWPAEQAGVMPPVQSSEPLVETPVLSSHAGAAVTLLNWTNDAIQRLVLELHLNFRVRSVRSVQLGLLPFRQIRNGVSVSLPLRAADILIVKP